VTPGLPDVRPLFRPLAARLDAALAELSEAQWLAPTAAGRGAWRVRDVAAHLLDGDVRQLAFRRDRHRASPPAGDLVEFLESLNATWVAACERMSPRLLAELLVWSGREVATLMEAQELDAPALFPVSWAGEGESSNRFDLARELAERWHHQQQIREAVGAAPLPADATFAAVVATLVAGLPHGYRDLREGPDAIRLELTGDGGGLWRLERSAGGWRFGDPARDADATLRLAADDAWRLWTKGLTVEEGRARLAVDGDERAAAPLLGYLAIVGRR
jgi:hypothetical protein